MVTLRVFADNMKRRGEAIKAGATKVQRACALAIDQTVVLATPVGDKDLWKNPASAPKGYTGGRARANWQVSVGSAASGEVDAVDKSGSATIGKGTATINGSTPGEAIHITNNLPYIVPLNEGHSKQAPAGFIELAINDGLAAVRNSKLME